LVPHSKARGGKPCGTPPFSSLCKNKENAHITSSLYESLRTFQLMLFEYQQSIAEKKKKQQFSESQNNFAEKIFIEKNKFAN
jgi:hypothetical protein